MFRKNLVVLRFRLLFTHYFLQSIFVMQTAQDRALPRLGDRAEVGDLKFASTKLHGHPPGFFAYWMGHGGEGMSELYDKIKADVRFRKEVAEKAGLGFELPNEFSSKTRVIGPNGPKLEKSRLEKVPASA